MRKNKFIIFICLTALLYIFFCTQKSKKFDTDDVHAKEAELKKRADKFYYTNDYRNAVKGFDSLLIYDTVNGEYYYKRGYSKSLLLDSTGAIFDYERSVKFGYRVPDAYLNIGVIYFYNRQYEKAEFYFTKCLLVEPNNLKAQKLKDRCKVYLNKRKISGLS